MKAAVCLHNYLRVSESSTHCPAGFADFEDGSGDFVPGEWRRDARGSGLADITRAGTNTASRSAKAIRDQFLDYFGSDEGHLPWQLEHVRRTG